MTRLTKQAMLKASKIAYRDYLQAIQEYKNK